MRTRSATGIVLGLLLCLLLAATASTARAQDAETYREALEQAADELRRTPSSAESVAATLDALPDITIEGSAPITPYLTHILEELRGDQPDVEVALERIEALLEMLERTALAPAGDDAAISALDSILARGEFTPPDPDRSPTLRERFSDWIIDIIATIAEPIAKWLAPLFGPSSGAGAGVVVLRAIMAIAGILAVIAIVVLVIRNVRSAMSADIAHLDAERELKLTSADARADAERLFQSGNYREALRYLYLATLLRLDEAGRLRFDRSLTNQEVLGSTRLHGDQTLLEQLSPLVDRFDRVWYGGAPCSADDYRDFSTLAERVWEAPA